MSALITEVGLRDMDFDELFTKDKPVVFAFHAYPWLIHQLTYRRTNHNNIHVRGDRDTYGEDLPDIRDWKWDASKIA